MINAPTTRKGFLNGNLIKIIALITMTIDHVGVMLFPAVEWLRIVGRISMPLYAFLIAEGCKYTKNKLRYFLLVFLLGVACQVVYYVNDGSLFMGILIVFSISIATIYAFQYAFKSKKWYCYLLPISLIVLAYFVNYYLPDFIKEGSLIFDYGFFGMTLPVIIYLFDYIFKNKWLTLFGVAIGLLPLSIGSWSLQWWSYLSLIPLAFYNGERGKLNLKYAFYVYYPLHLVVIYAIRFFA